MQARLQGDFRDPPRLVRGVSVLIVSDDLGNPIGVYKQINEGLLHIGAGHPDFAKTLHEFGLGLNAPVVTDIKGLH